MFLLESGKDHDNLNKDECNSVTGVALDGFLSGRIIISLGDKTRAPDCFVARESRNRGDGIVFRVRYSARSYFTWKFVGRRGLLLRGAATLTTSGNKKKKEKN